MPLFAHVVRRALSALVLAAVAASAALLLTLLAPANAITEVDLTPEERAAQEHALGLDRPLIIQYLDWFSKAMRLDFGSSSKYQRPVVDLLGERLVNTAILATTALAGATLLGIPLGIFTAFAAGSIAARIVRWISLVLLSTPPLVASLFLLVVAGRTRWLPTGGMTSVPAFDAPPTPWLLDVALHVVLPALALALPLAAHLEQLQSQALSDVAREPFVRAARARGLSPVAALLRHGWRASLRSVLGVYGVMIGALFSGSFIVEVVTAWPGLGRLTLDALLARDLYLVAGCAAAAAATLAAGTFLSDLLLTMADPRAHAEARS